jgi:hypothetical protein
MLAEAVRLPVSSHSPSLRWFGGAIAHPDRYEARGGEPAFCDRNTGTGLSLFRRGRECTLDRNGKKGEDLTGSLISFSTAVGEDIKIVKQSVTSDSLSESIPAAK